MAGRPLFAIVRRTTKHGRIVRFADRLHPIFNGHPVGRIVSCSNVVRFVYGGVDNASRYAMGVALAVSLGVEMHEEIEAFNAAQTTGDREICDTLAAEIDRGLAKAESKIWHRHPVWFLDGNPIVGYSKLKSCVRLLFWSGQSFDEPGLAPEGSFKAAEARYTSADQIDKKSLQRWLTKSKRIQWDYKNIVKRKGKLQRLK